MTVNDGKPTNGSSRHPGSRASSPRVVEEARKNLLSAIDVNLLALERVFRSGTDGRSNRRCIRSECMVERMCLGVIRQAIKILEETKSNYHSRELGDLRRTMQKFLEDTEERRVVGPGERSPESGE